MIFADFNPIS